MARFYKIQLDTIFLTKTGLTGGQQCKLKVRGVDKLQFDYIEQIERDFHGNPIALQTDVGTKGRTVEIYDIEVLPEAVADSLVTAIRTAQVNQTTMTLTGTLADTPNFTLTVMPGEDPFTFEEFTSFGNYLNSSLRFVVTA